MAYCLVFCIGSCVPVHEDRTCFLASLGNLTRNNISATKFSSLTMRLYCLILLSLIRLLLVLLLLFLLLPLILSFNFKSHNFIPLGTKFELLNFVQNYSYRYKEASVTRICTNNDSCETKCDWLSGSDETGNWLMIETS